MTSATKHVLYTNRCILLLFGIAMILVGYFLYKTVNTLLLDYTYEANTEETGALSIVLALRNYIPDMIHPFSMTAICYSLFAHSRKNCLVYALLWAFINILFEAGQLLQHTNSNLPSPFLNYPTSKHILEYFYYGTFDFIDIIMYLFGSLTGYLASIFILKPTLNKHYDHT